MQKQSIKNPDEKKPRQLDIELDDDLKELLGGKSGIKELLEILKESLPGVEINIVDVEDASNSIPTNKWNPIKRKHKCRMSG